MIATSKQMGSGPILAICNCDVVTGTSSFHLFVLQLLLFIDHEESSGTCKNAVKSNISWKMENIIDSVMVSTATEH